MTSETRKNRLRSGLMTEPAAEEKRPQQKVTGTMIGRIAQSTAGRDAGRLFVIIGEIDDLHVAVADGRLRKYMHPKKKKLRHLKLLSFAGLECMEKIADGMCNDSYIRRVLSAFRGENEAQSDHD